MNASGLFLRHKHNEPRLRDGVASPDGGCILIKLSRLYAGVWRNIDYSISFRHHLRGQECRSESLSQLESRRKGGPAQLNQLRSSGRIQPTAQAVGTKAE